MNTAVSPPALIVFCGLPGVGKTSIARRVASAAGAAYLRIDSIEQALARCTGQAVTGPEGYAIAQALAAENLRLGRRVVADAVNAGAAARAGWVRVAQDLGAPCRFVHLHCSREEEHRRRVRERTTDLAGHVPPSWSQIAALAMDPPEPDALVLDTAEGSAEALAAAVLARLGLSGVSMGAGASESPR
ncbi:AAA family ATPase [Ramlibacter rhizophilus]|uniref:AAA family ATPase n=1 Tax=Ramlibacter rhizophilus TaxID=1781167 RepID=A0A4Z0BT70_9BURK|nr:AAA family ATPase [Ramlibacter rhizophilus]TFZ01199.1 AAA family ATPase [Ramlibacter rhizophilus]